MNNYFYLAKNRQGLLKSGVISGVSAFDAYSKASKVVSKWSDDIYVIVKLERIE